MIVNQHESHVVCLELYTGADQARSDFVAVDLLTLLAPHLTRAWRLAGVQAAPEPGGSDACRTGYDIAGAAKVTASPAVMRLRADFGLTKAEARLALSLAAGASLLHAAEAYDVKLTTIRSQLQQIFAKTGTCRQAELVAMLLNQGYLDGARWDRAGAGPHAGPRPSAGLTAPPADLRRLATRRCPSPSREPTPTASAVSSGRSRAATDLARRYGRRPRGAPGRRRAAGHWLTTTFIVGLRQTDVIAVPGA